MAAFVWSHCWREVGEASDNQPTQSGDHSQSHIPTPGSRMCRVDERQERKKEGERRGRILVQLEYSVIFVKKI